MSGFSTLVEAWGCENFDNKKPRKKKRRKKRKETFQDYESIHQGQNILNEDGESIYGARRQRRSKRNRNHYSRPLNIKRNNASSRTIEPIKIKLEEEEIEYEGYNSSDYDQYELEDNRDQPVYSNNDYAVSKTQNIQVNNDTSVMYDDYEPLYQTFNHFYQTHSAPNENEFSIGTVTF